MPSLIAYHDGQFIEWSTIVDAPTSRAMPIHQFKKHYLWRYGAHSMSGLQRRLDRAISTGTSEVGGGTFEDLVLGNRAGPNETELSLEEIIQHFFAKQEGTAP